MAILPKSGEAATPNQVPLDSGLETVTVLDGYDPAATGVHVALPELLAYVPGAQAVHAVLPASGLLVPGPHAVHPLVLGVTAEP